MIRNLPSALSRNRTSSEREKLLLKASSSDSSRQNKDHPYFQNPEAFAVLILLILFGFGSYHGIFSHNAYSRIYQSSVIMDHPKSGIATCKGSPCFEPSEIHVPLSTPGFPSFMEYANRGPFLVSYDERSLKLNGNRVLFLGGSMHPARATFQTWNFALDEAVENGLNLITIYVMWADHQPVANKAIDWTFPDWSLPDKGACHDIIDNKSCSNWNLANAIRSAANRGLFVHLRIGPYDCAEYSYGGIPEWLPVEKPNIRLRRPNQEWLETMEHFVAQIIDYISDNELWAYQGGPIIMGQIENELGSGDDRDNQSEDINADDDGYLYVTDKGEFVEPLEENVTCPIRKATLQDYADWCGEIAKKYAPNVTWTMCNGLSANNTIRTCNAINNGATWLENYGGNGRIQVDQPPLLTEFEEGFQDWGETPEHPSDYFWGRTASTATSDALRWFSRGGTHLNHYMFFGAYNRGRQAAGGITNWYAADAALCPSGQRHEPKFSHYRSLHQAIASIASTLLSAETALGKVKAVEVLNEKEMWVVGRKQRMFEYTAKKKQLETQLKQVTFVENDDNDEVVIRIPVMNDESMEYQQFTLGPTSAIVIVDKMLKFDSSAINPQAMLFKREFAYSSLFGWSFWPETIGAETSDPITRTGYSPIEQTKLNVESNVWSDYAWYETSLPIEKNLTNLKLLVECQRSNGLLVFVDDSFVGAAEDHSHIFEGNLTMVVEIGQLSKGQHKLSILSESMGYSNLIGRFGNSLTGPKLKGISGQVYLLHEDSMRNVSLIDGREWRSYPGLHGEKVSKEKKSKSVHSKNPRPMWASVMFHLPQFDPKFQSLFLQISTGRGHFWLNGKDLGRYWNITQGVTSKFSQEYYLLPIDYLRTDGVLNEIVIFNTACISTSELENGITLVVSWIAPSDRPNFKDEVSYPLACI